jgi:hypothetical protein
MKSKQLANVLIKITGLYICVFAIPALVAGIVVWLTSHDLWAQSNRGTLLTEMLSALVRSAVQAGVGVFLIVWSRPIAGWLFKNEEE